MFWTNPKKKKKGKWCKQTKQGLIRILSKCQLQQNRYSDRRLYYSRLLWFDWLISSMQDFNVPWRSRPASKHVSGFHLLADDAQCAFSYTSRRGFVQLCIRRSFKLGCVTSKGTRRLLLTSDVRRSADIRWTRRPVFGASLAAPNPASFAVWSHIKDWAITCSFTLMKGSFKHKCSLLTTPDFKCTLYYGNYSPHLPAFSALCKMVVYIFEKALFIYLLIYLFIFLVCECDGILNILHIYCF